MSTLHSIMQFLLAADGTHQLQRNAKALSSGYVRMDERDTKQLLEFLISIAEQTRFYDLNNLPAGDWRKFFSQFIKDGAVLSTTSLLQLEESRDDWSPHGALLWAFLKIFGIAQADMNKLTDQHLLYYYKDVLQLPQKTATPDQLHAIFTLARNASQTLLQEGTLLDAGKFDDGTLRQYALNHDIVISHATVERVLSYYADRDKSGRKILFISSDATRIRHGESEAWRPFGTSQLKTSIEQRNMDAAAIGFSIASPSLLLEEGLRTITVTLAISSNPAPPPQVLTSAFDIEFSSSEGWVRPSAMTVQITADSKLKIVASLSETIPSITKYRVELHAGTYDTRWPIMRCRIRSQAYVLEALDTLSASSVEIQVAVSGLRNLILQNDQSVQLAGKPVSPFTSLPFLGANFYIGSNEAFQKSLTSLGIHLEWQDPPSDFSAYYTPYGINAGDMSNTGSFTARLSLLAGKNWNTNFGNGKFSLFSSDTSAAKIISVDPGVFLSSLASSGFSRNPDIPDFREFDLKLRQGFVKLELIEPTRADLQNLPADAPFEAFGHKSFATVYARQAIALAQFGGVGTPPELPKPPYTPMLKSVTLDYSAKEVFYPANPNYIDEYFIEDLFGPQKIGRNEPVRLIPELSGDGALYVGLKNASVPQGISMLFQVEEGSTPGESLIAKEDLEWSYLSAQGWTAIQVHHILEDSTKVLQQPGLIRLNLGQDAVSNATRMPLGLHWLRLIARQHPDGASSILEIRAQAASVTLSTLSANQSAALGTLPEKSVTGLVRKRSAIKQVEQPYPSFGGQPSEQLNYYSRRVSERIRHRNRAVTTWDYERIILDRFPDIFKVKCVPHSNDLNQIVPGAVHAVVVPDWRKRKSGNPLQPAANAAFLREIEETLNAEVISPFTALLVTNPAFETLLVDTRVSFHPEFDPGFYALQLEEEIKRFLSPWAYEEGQDIQFGGRVYRSEILAFIEGREYVDFVVDFQLYHRHSSGTIGGIGQMVIGQDFIIGVSPVPTVNAAAIGVDFIIGEPVDISVATRPDTILVSNSYHRINVLQSDNICAGVVQTGIGQMIIGIDFVPIS
ncbi:MAG TPA: hypothetical protein VI603_11615 [Saprospiraceae bacterium]|nr:hypothetical protein [Saprospiraceae bacterium]